MNRSRAAALASISLGVGLLVQYLFVRQLIGVNVPLTVIVVLVAAFAMRPSDASLDARDAWLPAGAILLGVLCAIRTDVPLVVFDLIGAVSLTLAAVISLSGLRVWELDLPALVVTSWSSVTRTVSGGAAVMYLAAPLLRTRALSRSSGAAPHAGGVLLAVPFLLVFGALFSSADAVFRHVLESVVDLAELRRLVAELPVRVVLASITALVTAGALSTLDRRVDGTFALRRPIAGATATTMLFAIDALFAAFVLIQFTYLFGGRDTLDAAAITYSEYGRSGFFELVAAASTVAALLFVLDLMLEARDRYYVLAALTLVGLTGVVLASATLRMELYQTAYGWSELRFYAFTGIAYIAIALPILGWAIVGGSMTRAVQPLTLAAVVVALTVNVIGPAGFVARQNLERVIEPESLPADATRELDVPYLIALGDGAVPAMVELAPRLDEPARSRVIEAIRVQSQQRAALPGWQSFVVDRERARSLAVRAAGEDRFIR